MADIAKERASERAKCTQPGRTGRAAPPYQNHPLAPHGVLAPFHASSRSISPYSALMLAAAWGSQDLS